MGVPIGTFFALAKVAMHRRHEAMMTHLYWITSNHHKHDADNNCNEASLNILYMPAIAQSIQQWMLSLSIKINY